MAENNKLTEESEGLIYSSISHGIREEAIDVFEAVSIDRNRLHGLLRSLGTIAVRSSPIQQFGMGLGIGWISGYLFRRVSRTAAFLLGCGFLAVQGATALGLITINTERIQELARRNMIVMERRVTRAMSSNNDDDENQQLSVYEKLTYLANQHVYLSSGFISGAVIAFTF